MIEALGFIAGILTSGAALPQVVKSWRTRSVADLSIVMLTMLNLGLLMWVIYGVSRRDLPITFTNGFSFMLWGSLLWLKVQHSRMRQ
jgi:MtN3 and saliva related transmembrane protein